MEESGRVRRGYFVEGLGGAQFALPGAVDRLRGERDPASEPRIRVLAASDPANPFGASLPWPKRDQDARRALQRVAGAFVVLVDGEPSLYLERGGRSLLTLPSFTPDERGLLALTALRQVADVSPRRELRLDRVDGRNVLDAPLAPLLLAAGFQRDYLGMLLRLVAPPVTRARTA
jgi:ATP-dependent Lhr-like helicase